MRRMTRSACAAVVVLALLLTQSARAQVFDQVPAEALVVLKVNNLAAASQKFGKWAEAIGVTAFQPDLKDPLAAIQKHMGMSQGVDTAGEMAFVFLNPQAVGGDEDKAVMVLVPVTDYKAFVGQFPESKTEGAITSMKPEGAPETVYAANWGKYAAMGMVQDVLSKKPAGLKLPPASAKEVNARDAVVWANITAVREIALPALQQSRGQIMDEVQNGLENDPNAPKQFAPVIKATVGQFLTAAEQFLKDSDSALVGLTFNDDGVRIASMAEFQPDSYFANIAKDVQGTNQQLIKGLPDRKYFAVFGASIQGEGFRRGFKDLVEPILQELGKVEGGDQFAGLIDSMMKGMTATKSVSFGYVMPEGNVGQESLIQAVAVSKGDAPAIGEAQRSIMQAYGKFFSNLPKGGPEVKFEIMPGQKTVGGAKLDEFKMDMKMGDGPQQQQAQMMMGMIYGPNGMTGVMGVVDNNTYIVVQGGTDALIEQAVAAAKANQDNPAFLQGSEVVSKNLPQNRFMVGYVALDNIVRSIAKTAAGFGAPIKIELPDTLPPIGFAAATEGTAIRMDTFIPTPLVQHLIRSGTELYMQVQGGQGAPGAQPGAPGGL